MASLLERYQKEIIGSGGKIADYTSRISAKGDFTRVKNINAILLHWRNILLTPLRSYDNDPEFGSELYKYVFDPADEDTIEKIEDEVNYRLSVFDDRANITDIEVQFLSNRKGFNVKVGVEYLGEEDDLIVTIDEKTYLSFMEN